MRKFGLHDQLFNITVYSRFHSYQTLHLSFLNKGSDGVNIIGDAVFLTLMPMSVLMLRSLCLTKHFRYFIL